jgi:hypothetical protein
MRVFVAVTACLVLLAPAARPAPTQRTWTQGVTRICLHALLFEHRHTIGTEQGARDVARDIRASTASRLERIGSLRARPDRPRVARAWLRTERALADLYADTYLRIWQAIDRANNPSARRRLPAVVHRLVHRPDGLQAVAVSFEQELSVPDCTGGENTNTVSSLIAP